jgi:hypothetical protein
MVHFLHSLKRSKWPSREQLYTTRSAKRCAPNANRFVALARILRLELSVAENSEPRVHLKPLFFGRLTRVIFGLATTCWAVRLWHATLPAVAASTAVFLLGVSFLLGGLMANPGCEITALLNLGKPAEKRIHCF